MNDTKNTLGISMVLPSPAATRLVRAAESARELPLGSLERLKIIARAIESVRAEHPRAFISPDEREDALHGVHQKTNNCRSK